MAQDNLRLISARIDEYSIDKIETLTQKHGYWKKNFIIRQILYAVLHDFDEQDIYNMLKRPRSSKFKAKSEYIYPYVGGVTIE
mgnify:FL=1